MRQNYPILEFDPDPMAIIGPGLGKHPDVPEQILYGGDNLDGEEWDGRAWNKNWSVREKLIALAAEAVVEL